MLQETYFSSGKNNFKDNEFSHREWSAPSMVDPEEIKALVATFHLEGRTIKRLKFIGMDYAHSRDFIEDYAYRSQKQYDEEERQRLSEYDNIPPEIMYGRYAELDEPLLVWFEDDDVFEIDTPQEPEFRMSMNCVPWHIDEGCNLRNVDPEVLLSDCIGKTIRSVEVRTYQTDKDPMFGKYFDDEHTGKELVSAVILRFEDGYGLRIGPHIDFTDVDSVDPDDHLTEISFAELKEGLYNWEDLHIERATGYSSESGRLYFNDLGRRHVGSPYTCLSCGDSEAFIDSDDYTLLRWAVISNLMRQPNIYEEISFDSAQWNSILRDAEKLIGYESFDDLFDDLTGRGITFSDGRNAMVWYLNGMGAEVWKRAGIHRNILSDVRKWTETMMPDGGTVTVCGDD